MRGAGELNPNVSDEYMGKRAQQYQMLMSHAFRDLFYTIDGFRGLDEWTDKKITAHPQTIRMIFRELLTNADEWWQEMQACYEVSDEHLEEFVRARTSPMWRKLMEESGMVWQKDHYERGHGHWVPKRRES